jgi:hypothetical protein
VKSIVAVVFAVTLGWVAAADAGGPRATVKGHHPHRGFIVQDRGLEVFGERRITVQPNPCLNSVGQWQCGGAPPAAKPERHRQHRPHPAFVVPQQNCWVSGYWTTQWVPQTSLYTVWVDPHFATDGSWVEGRYEQRSYVSGYAQQALWIPERWAC